MTSEQLERETEQTRAAFEQTLEELRARITPGHVVDQLVDYVRGGPAAAFFRNLGQRTVDNPMPLLVIGAGLAWLMIANGGSANGAARRIDSAADGDDTRRDMSVMAGKRGGTGERIAGAARSAASAVGDLAQRAKDRVGSVAGTNPQEPQLGQREARTAGFTHFLHEHPIVLVGLGLAIGAAIGAAITPSRSEEQEEGEAKDRMAHMGEGAHNGAYRHDEEAAKDRVAHMGEAAQAGSGPGYGSDDTARQAPMAGQ